MKIRFGDESVAELIGSGVDTGEAGLVVTLLKGGEALVDISPPQRSMR